jgi:hypothetical protein
MASNARKAFDQNTEDVKLLLDFPSFSGAPSPEVIHKSAIVLITAFWEAYCEDLAEEALNHIVANITTASKLPKELKKRIAKEIKEGKNDNLMWELADAGWKVKVKARLNELAAERNANLNTPKTAPINELFEKAIGLQSVSASWAQDGKTHLETEKKLDEFVSLRGDVAHRGKAAASVKDKQVREYFALTQHLVKKTGGKVSAYVKTVTGKPLW